MLIRENSLKEKTNAKNKNFFFCKIILILCPIFAKAVTSQVLLRLKKQNYSSYDSANIAPAFFLLSKPNP